MSTHKDAFFQLLVRCPRCEGRNAVDIRKQGLAKRARCGRCGEPLPRRIPAPLLLLGMSLLLVGAGIIHFGLEGMRTHRAKGRRAEVQRMLHEKRPADAVRLLSMPRTEASEDGLLARRVAEALAGPVLEAARDPAIGRATVEGAVDLGDQLLEEHEKRLPELLMIVDEPLRRLQARLSAFDLVEPARSLSTQASPDLAAVEQLLQEAAVKALDAPPDVAVAVEELSAGIRSRAVLTRARGLVTRRPDEARQLLARTVGRIPPVRGGDLQRLVETSDEAPVGTLLELRTSIRGAIDARDLDALVRVVHARPDDSWDADAREELDRELRRACLALGSLAAERASTEPDPAKRAGLLLKAMSCDELLPREFLLGARLALAQSLLEVARRGGSLEDALVAFESVASGRRDDGLARLGCLAEARSAHATALLAWSRVGSASALQRLTRCADEPIESEVPHAPPSLDYPSSGSSPGPALGG